jgi:hypothetical protein
MLSWVTRYRNMSDNVCHDTSRRITNDGHALLFLDNEGSSNVARLGLASGHPDDHFPRRATFEDPSLSRKRLPAAMATRHCDGPSSLGESIVNRHENENETHGNVFKLMKRHRGNMFPRWCFIILLHSQATTRNQKS